MEEEEGASEGEVTEEEDSESEDEQVEYTSPPPIYNTYSLPIIRPPEYTPPRIYAHQFWPLSEYTPRAYIPTFTVYIYIYNIII